MNMQVSTYNFNDLPVELIHLVFGYVSDRARVDRLVLVSKLWADIIPPIMLDWFNKKSKCFSLLGCKDGDGAIKKLKEEEWLSSVNLCKFDLNDIHILSISQEQVAVRIKRLHLYRCKRISEGVLAQNFFSLVNLKRLTLEACKHFKKNKLIQALFQMQTLEELDLSNCSRICAPSISKLDSLNKLTVLNLSGCQRLIKSSQIFSKFPNLRTLNLTGLKLSHRHIKAIFSFLLKLEVLNLSKCDFDGMKTKRLRLLSKHHHLEKIVFSGALIKSWNKIEAIVESCPNLKHLFLRKQIIIGEELMLLLNHEQQLQFLDLSGSQIYFMIESSRDPHLNLVSLTWRGKRQDPELSSLVANLPGLKFLDIRDRGFKTDDTLYKEMISLLPQHKEILI